MTTRLQEATMVTFDHQYLLQNLAVLQNLCDVYCGIWERDEHFGEYRQCPSCHRYFSVSDVETNGVSSCPECSLPLAKAWLPVSVALDVLSTAKHHSFSGVLLMAGQEVLGFAWGRLYSNQEMLARWGDIYPQFHALNPEALYSFYLEELALTEKWRGRGLGKKLVKQVLSKPFCSYPNVPGALSTHQDSTSVAIYRHLGFDKIADNPAGQGRIRMGIGRIAQVNMFK